MNSNTNITGMNPNTNYCFAIKSNCSGTQSEFSNYECISTPASLVRESGVSSTVNTLEITEIETNDNVNKIDSYEFLVPSLSMEVYPNPVIKGEIFMLNIQANQTEIVNIKVSDISGRLVVNEQKQIEVGNQEIKLIAPKNSGLYLISVQTDTEIKTAKIFVR